MEHTRLMGLANAVQSAKRLVNGTREELAAADRVQMRAKREYEEANRLLNEARSAMQIYVEDLR